MKTNGLQSWLIYYFAAVEILNKNLSTINYHCNHLNQLSCEVISLKTFHLIIQIYIYLEDKIFVCTLCFCSNLTLLIFKITKLICNVVNDKMGSKSKKEP